MLPRTYWFASQAVSDRRWAAAGAVKRSKASDSEPILLIPLNVAAPASAKALFK